MSSISDGQYAKSFKKITEKEGRAFDPYPYQIEVARLLFAGRNVLLRAPTGAGKTWAAIAPFLSDGWSARPNRLIYALPLRTLANGIYREARSAAANLGKRLEPLVQHNREVEHPFVTLQTGEQPDDPFFDRGTIIITTYDQVLSGLLCGPYGLSERLHNVNAAAIAGALVVFDEFHLMPAAKAFLTAVAGLHLFRDLCQSVWMTATATEPLEQILRSALEIAVVPDGEAAMRSMHKSLPSVTSVNRSLVAEPAQLSADAILRYHQRRSIAIVNTVGRTQQLFSELRTKLADQADVRLIMLHSRFFKDDRKHLEAELQNLFQRDAQQSAILVATQVIEAGIDISCEHLHTELCPMNSLAQRAGRCARFPHETGTVHVYRLPDALMSWLPYGDTGYEDPTLTATRNLLTEWNEQKLDSAIVAQWVQAVHGKADEDAMLSDYRPRTKKVVNCIFQNSIQRNPVGIAHLIRGNDSESIRVLIADERALPESPGKLESISLSRWSLRPHLNGGNKIGWYWSADEQHPWQPLENRKHLNATYAVCLRPEFAGYSPEFGLRLGESGIPSPCRDEPPRPGHSPLREEPWVNHARMVADEMKARFSRDGTPTGLAAAGFHSRYRLIADEMLAAARACGLLHDLGKLQIRWQQWAEQYQKKKDSSYTMPGPLAHTDFNYDSVQDRAYAGSIDIRRPPHSAASAFYSLAVLESALRTVAPERRPELASACVSAILAHHGSFVPKGPGIDLDILPLADEWTKRLSGFDGYMANPAILQLLKRSDKKGILNQCLNLTTSLGALEQWWPLVAYLMRTLRLADQRATSEWSCRE